MRKNGHTIWKCWRSKFESTSKCVEVDWCVDPNTIADKFANYFSINFFSCNNKEKAESLAIAYNNLRPTYCGLPPVSDLCFDTERVSKVISVLKRGLAVDGLNSEHIVFSHPVLTVITRLFQLILFTQHILHSIVPIPKLKDTRTKAISCDDFRGIAITPILSKIFEYCFF